MAPKAAAAPAIFHTEKGVTWSYQPDTQTWSATDGTRRTRSQSFDTVRDKQREWSAAPSAPVSQVPDVLESHAVALPAVVDALVNAGRPIKAAGISIKSEWNVPKGRPQVMRFKDDRDGAGWATLGADTLRLVSPEAAAAHVDVWRRLVSQGEDMAAIVAAEKALAKTWAGSKTDATRFIDDKGTRAEPIWADTTRPSSRFGSSRDLIVSSTLWPTLIPGALPNASLQDWEQASDGSYHRAGVRLSLRIAGQYSGPEFVVERRVEGAMEEVAAQRDWPVALALACATVASQTEAWEPVEAWHAREKWVEERTGNGTVSWPSRSRVLGAAAIVSADLRRTDDRATLYVLAQPLPHPVGALDSARTYSSGKSPDHPVWSSSRSNSDIVWFATGPEDEPVMAALKALRILRAEVETRIARDEVRDMLAAQTQDVLRQLHEAHANGDEPVASPKAALGAWERWLDRLQARVRAEPERAAMAERIAEAVALAVPSPSPRSTPRP